MQPGSCTAELIPTMTGLSASMSSYLSSDKCTPKPKSKDGELRSGGSYSMSMIRTEISDLLGMNFTPYLNSVKSSITSSLHVIPSTELEDWF